ncbi:hypothetical protein [Furfurilactobacillus curtus]|uniref:Uncharacterized protein n=1 Tax=Furfurilactobacillus curtus TaxID=1746200 RepID=A0ABQ5JNF2_9LACO
MGTGSKSISLFFLVVYGFLIYLVFTMQNMLAMEVMAAGMFLQALIDCWCAFRKPKVHIEEES